jgi:8-oxo-dGTP pyrophosphatase MutT (NUDIX family)
MWVFYDLRADGLAASPDSRHEAIQAAGVGAGRDPYDRDLQVLLLERAAHAGYWQSVTGSQEAGEPLLTTAIREVAEETGIKVRAEGFWIGSSATATRFLPNGAIVTLRASCTIPSTSSRCCFRQHRPVTIAAR